MKIPTLAAALVVVAALTGCKSKEEKCVENCALAFATQDGMCDSPTQPDQAGCHNHAAEGRWVCRKSCGISEPNPVAAATSAKPAKTATAAPPRVPFDRELDKVCGGTPEPQAAAFDPTKGKHNAAIVFSKTGAGNKLVAQTLGEDYKALGVQGSDGTATLKADAYSIVVCVDVKDHKKVRDCPFPKHALELHDATFQIRVLEARTAKVLADETVDLKHNLKKCPTAWNFWSERDVSLPLHSEAVIKVAKKFVDP